LLTSNRPPAEWPGLFGDPLLASAGIDRLCHRAEILIIRGQSFRSYQRQQQEDPFSSAERLTEGAAGG